jgi:ADP-heptose:LPS heptosyltransferase
MTGSVTDWQVAECRKIEAVAGDLVRNLSGQTSLRNYLWLVANARLVLTVDSAAAHLAAAFGVPNFTLFGPTDHRNWHWPAPGSAIACAPRGNDGLHLMQYLDAGAVKAAVMDFCGKQGVFDR